MLRCILIALLFLKLINGALAEATTRPSRMTTLGAAGQRTLLQDSWGHTSYGYDAAGRLTSANYPDGSTEADQYDPAGNRTVITSTTTLSGTLVTSNQYDAANELAGRAAGGPGAHSYSYDGNGNQLASSGCRRRNARGSPELLLHW